MFAVSIGVARLVPDAADRPPGSRRTAHAQLIEINSTALTVATPECRFVDAETGQFVNLHLPARDTLMYASSSPWTDERGECEVVGRWMSRGPNLSDGTYESFGLGRFAYPTGRTLERVALDIVPAGTPCWFPGNSSRVLFAGTDGTLYSFWFDGPATAPFRSEHADGDSRLQHVVWRCAQPGHGDVRINDPIWPSAAQLGGRIIASLQFLDQVDDELDFAGHQLWWLKLSADGSAIVDAGRLTEPPRAGKPEHLERMPNVAVTADGRLVLAYLNRPPQQTTWQLRLAPVVCDPVTRAPKAQMAESRTIMEQALFVTPTFSPDGLWVNAIHTTETSGRHANRLSVAAQLRNPEPNRIVWDGGSRQSTAARRSAPSDSRQTPLRSGS